MKQDELPLTFFGDWYTDFKAEVTAAEMVELGIPDDQVIILLLGAMKRSARKDIQSIEEELSVYDRKEYVVIKTPKEGIYDMLPEGLFHHPSATNQRNRRKRLLRSSNSGKKKNRMPGSFSFPLRQRSITSVYNWPFMKTASTNAPITTNWYPSLHDHWEIFQYLDKRQADLFLHLIPILHDMRGNLPVQKPSCK